MLTKNARYFYDNEAVKEAASYSVPSDRRASGEYSAGSGRNDGGPHRSGGFVTGAFRNLRSVWTIATQPFSGAHFATMPPKLVETCIKAGTSEKGCCPSCGAPWVRVVERISGDTEAASRPKRTAGMSSSTSTLSLSGNGSMEWTLRGSKHIDVGFQQLCDCLPIDPIPCTVLDPFAGAGTTGLVADRLQRDSILIDLSSKYFEMSASRIKDDAPLFAQVRNEIPDSG
jgi:hypothetical protein